MTWLVVLLLPMLAMVQTIAASVAAVSGLSLQEAIAESYGPIPSAIAAASIVAVCVFTLGADVRAGADALTLLTGLPARWFVVPLVAAAGWLLATKSYLRVERILASFTLVFLCYVASAIYARPDWGAIARSLLPAVVPTREFLTGALALLGTTLTGYVYFWESIEVAERRPHRSEVRAISSDAALGMLVAGSSFFFILVATAATSGRMHVELRTAADAAIALQPLAGRWDEALFGIGLLASAAIAIPIIAATNGYVVAQTLRRAGSLTLEVREAPLFYSVVVASLVLAATLALSPLGTMWLLYWSSVAAGIATPVTLALTMLVARNRKTMSGAPIGVPLAMGGWFVTAVVTLASAWFILERVA